MFDFKIPAAVSSATILDIDDEKTPIISLTYSSGKMEHIPTVLTGNNGVLDLPIKKDDVVQFKICFNGSGAIR